MVESYYEHAKGIRILPGKWRPHYPWEHIVWVSPPWPCQDYIWLDFPEAIFTDQGLHFLSHVNPPIHTLFEDLPKVEWREVKGGIAFDRELPNKVRFGGSVTKKDESSVALELWIENGSDAPMTRIQLQTCAFLRAIDEFNHPTMANKYIHTPGKGWLSWPEATEIEGEPGTLRLGFRGGPKIADKPTMIVRSEKDRRMVSMTWFEDTNTLVGNPNHPCFHADPKFPDLAVGEKATIHGELRFSEELPEGID